MELLRSNWASFPLRKRPNPRNGRGGRSLSTNWPVIHTHKDIIHITTHITTHICIPRGGRSLSKNWPLLHTHKDIYILLHELLHICVYPAEAAPFPQIDLLYTRMEIYTYYYTYYYTYLYTPRRPQPVNKLSCHIYAQKYIHEDIYIKIYTERYIHKGTCRRIYAYSYTYVYTPRRPRPCHKLACYINIFTSINIYTY